MSADRWARISARLRYGDRGPVTDELIVRYAADGVERLQAWLMDRSGS